MGACVEGCGGAGGEGVAKERGAKGVWVEMEGGAQGKRPPPPRALTGGADGDEAPPRHHLHLARIVGQRGEATAVAVRRQDVGDD